MADIKITALKNGLYKVEGSIELFYGDLRVDTSQPTVMPDASAFLIVVDVQNTFVPGGSLAVPKVNEVRAENRST